MKFLTITKKNKIKFEAYIFNNGHLKIKTNHTRYKLMVEDVLKNNFKNKILEDEKTETLECGTTYNREIYKEEELSGDTPLEKLETYFEQFNDLFNYELKEEALYKSLIGETSSVDEAISIYERDYNKIEFPINMERIIKRLGIKLKIAPDFKDAERLGKASLINNQPQIFLNLLTHRTKGRKQFTLAHELGHVFTHILPQMSNEEPANDIEYSDTLETLAYNRDENWDLDEMQANQFAANLLMPIDNTKERFSYWSGLENKEEIITEMATEFVVSRAAMEIRLVTLGLIK